MTTRARTLITSTLLAAAALAGAPGTSSAMADPAPVPPPTRCAAPYDPAGTRGASDETVRRSAPALRWLRAVYGEPSDWTPGARHVDALRGVALRPCDLHRGAITVWTTQPAAMIRRAWKQPWIRRVDIQWVRVSYGGVQARRVVEAYLTGEDFDALGAAIGEGASVTTFGDDPARDCIAVGISSDTVPEGGAARASALLGVPACVDPGQRPMATGIG